MLSAVQQSALKQARMMLESMAEVRFSMLVVKQVTYIISLIALLFMSTQSTIYL